MAVKSCPGCGKQVSVSAPSCIYCGRLSDSPLFQPPTGTPEPAVTRRARSIAGAEFYFPVAIHKLIVMSVVTFGLYQIYWFYKQWKFMEASGEPGVRPLLRAIFSPLTCYGLFRRIREDATSAGIPLVWSATALAVLYILLNVSFRLPSPYFLICYTQALALVPVQRTVHELNAAADPSVGIDGGYSDANILGIIIGGGIMALIIFGLIPR